MLPLASVWGDGWMHMDGWGGGFFLFPFIMLLVGLAWLLLLIWVLYDVATRRDMQTPEKVLWIIVALFLGLIGPLIYILVVRLPNRPVFGQHRGELSELERLADLHERGVLSDEEFEELKEERLKRLKGSV